MTLANARVRIDAHQHFWRYSKAEYDWIDDSASMAVLRRDFGPEDLDAHLTALDFSGCIAVQARTDERENEYLLGLAKAHPFIRGVVGWLDLSGESLAHRLDAWSDNPRLVGFREVLQGMPPGTFLNEAFVRGLRLLGERDFTYDVLVYANQLEDVRELVGRARPDQRLVLDHLGKPDIKGGEFAGWARAIRSLAKDHPNLHCKLSGMVTEAAPRWSAADLRPYMETVLEAFGPKRLLYGSDWPVCLLAAPNYQTVHDVAADFVNTMGAEAAADIFGGNAQRFYKLS